MRIITDSVGERQIAKLLGPDFKRWHKNWSAPKESGGKPRLWRGKHCGDTLRAMINYGVTCGYADCMRADTILGKLRFKQPPPRTTKLELEHVNAIRPVAHAMGLGSIALATVFQFELDLRQKDVIGEWEPAPLSEGGIAYRGRRWVNGIVWTDIDPHLILTKTHTKIGAIVEHDLKLYPAILEELAMVPPERRVGPLIVSERTGQPYKHCRFIQLAKGGQRCRRPGRGPEQRRSGWRHIRGPRRWRPNRGQHEAVRPPGSANPRADLQSELAAADATRGRA